MICFLRLWLSFTVSHSHPSPLPSDLSHSPTSPASGPLAFQGLTYTGAYGSASVPLLSPEVVAVKVRDDLLEEVKDVLIPAEKLTIHYGQVIGQGKSRPFIQSLYIICFTPTVLNCNFISVTTLTTNVEGCSFIPLLCLFAYFFHKFSVRLCYPL